MFNIEVYSSHLFNEDPRKYQNTLSLSEEPLVLSSTDTIDTATWIGTAVVAALGLILVASEVKSNLDRAREAYRTTLVNDEQREWETSQANQLVTTISLTLAMKRTHVFGIINRLLAVPVLIVLVLSLTSGNLWPSVVGLAVLYVQFNLLSTGLRVHQWSLLLGLALLTASFYLEGNEFSGIDNAVTALLAGLILPLSWFLYRRRGETVLEEANISLFDVEDRYQQKISNGGLGILGRLLISMRFSIKGVTLMAVVAFLALVGASLALLMSGSFFAVLVFYWPISKLYTMAKQRLAPDAQQVLARDPRAPVLLLRAFMDDPAEITTDAGMQQRCVYGLDGSIQ